MMPKNILVLYYTQTGQLEDVVKNLAAPLEKAGNHVDYYRIQLKEDFPFPWPDDVFFNTFPESYLQVPKEILPPSDEILNKNYDLVIFGYQVWYLTPSIPTISFLKSPFADKILKKGTPVVTVSATRNMWMLSQQKLKTYLDKLGTKLVGNIALVDRHNNYTSTITILKWLGEGKKEMPSPLPPAGVSQEEIDGTGKYGEIIAKYLAARDYSGMQPELVKNGAVEVRPFLVKVETVGNKLFTFFSGRVKNQPEKRPFWVRMFKIYLMLAIWVISPIVLVFFTILTPVFWLKRKKQIEYYQGL